MATRAELTELLNACNAETLRALRQRLERPALSATIPQYDGKLACREDLTLRTERWWKEFTKQLSRTRSSRADFTGAATRANYTAYRRQSRYLGYCWRQVQKARLAAANC